MHDFLIKQLSNTDITRELQDIGFDRTYCQKASTKFEFQNFKIYNLTIAQANILKQTALSVGADCGTHKEVITGCQEISSCILGGSVSQLRKIAQKLQLQPFNLKKLGEQIIDQIRTYQVDNTKIIGILNITQNSFSDGGKYIKFEDAINQLNNLINDGADIIDIGAESTKPYSQKVSPEDQIKKLRPILQYIKENNIKTPISVDTRCATVAQETIELGANIINDVSGFDFDPNMVKVIAKNPNVKIIIQHSKGEPENMQDAPFYENLMDEIYLSLKNKVDIAISNGVKKSQIIIDPGIGFGKTREQNLEIIKRWKELKTIGCPVLLGISRKSLLNIANSTNVEKDIYTLALNSILMNENIDYIRVHNVKLHKNLQQILG